jgi:glycosyltransferase involved in cell wall biosynthesis/multidrug transporter EmrE-like cation transporter
MKVLVVSSYPPRHCGVGAYARDQVAALRAEGHEVTVLSPPDGDGDIKAQFLGGRAFARAAGMGGDFDRILVHFQPSLYYRPRRPLSKIATSFWLLELVLRWRRKVDVLVHEADPPARWRPDYALLGLAFRMAGRMSFHTEAERRALEGEYRLRVRGHVIPHRVVPVVAVSRREARARLGIEGGGPVFVCAGFIQSAKGFDRAVEAFARAGPNGGRLYVVGSIREPTPENLEYARALADRCRSVPGVTLVDRYLQDEEFDLWVAAADRLVLPYRRSWSSGVLARAQALGTPAIVTAVGGLPEQAGERDLVVRDDEELQDGMRRVSTGHSPGHPRAAEWTPGSEVPEGRKKGRGVLIGLILISVALAAVAQLTLKHGMNQVTSSGADPLSLRQPAHTVVRIITTPAVWGGLGLFVASASVWLIVLSRTSLSFAYPFASLTYVLILVFDRFVLKEPISGLRYGGVALIIAGLVLISRTHSR